jgi:ubiquinone/menaquinone biosynthesis C-methylase UbiE
MHYDSTSVPERYHASRAIASADVERWLSLVRDLLPKTTSTSVVVDLGCGTGRFTQPLADRLGMFVIGVDPSLRMLREATRTVATPQVAYREGRAESIPADSSSAALIFMSNAIHHVKDLGPALEEMRRVLQPDGIVFLRNYTLENLESLRYLEFFPEAMQLSREMVWSRSTLVEQFSYGGFDELTQGTIRQEASPDRETYLRKIESRVYSDLALMSDEAFDRGIAKMRGAGTWPQGAVMEDVDYFAFQKR